MVIMVIVGLFSGVFASRYPEQIKLAWTDTPGEMVVNWASYDAGNPKLQYALESSDKWKVVYANQEPYKEGPDRLMYENWALMTNLKPGETYHYIVGSFPYYSEKYSFSIPTEDHVYNIAVFGDWGVGRHGKKTTESLKRRSDIDGIFLMGDIAYDLHTDKGKRGDAFLNEIQPIVAEMPFMVVPGNHEDYEQFSQVIGRFTMPPNKYNNYTGTFYSIDIGLGHFIMFNTEIYLMNIEEQIRNQTDFLIADLEKANQNRENVPWIIAMTHHPLYCASYIEDDDCGVNAIFYRFYLEELFNQYKVDLMMSGHLHEYEREGPIYQNRTAKAEYEEQNYVKNAEAPIYILSGYGGNSEGPHDPPKGNPEWLRSQSREPGYGTFTFYNKTTLFWQQFVAEDDSVCDHLHIVKDK